MIMTGNFIAVYEDLLKLDQAVAATKGQSVKESTKKNLLTQLNAYQKFCNRYRLQYFPCNTHQLCRFGQHLSESLESPDSIGNYISGIRTCMAMWGLDIPDAADRQMKMFITGLKKAMPHAIKQAEPITPHILLKLSKVVNYKDQVEMVAWTVLLMGFYMFLRKSNLVPDTMTSFNKDQQFCRSDINLMGPDKAMMVEIRWSKTIQHKQKILRLPILPANNKAICPVFWVHYMVSRISAAPHDPAFSLTSAAQGLALSYNQLIYRFRKWLKLINLDDSIFSLHSLR